MMAMTSGDIGRAPIRMSPKRGSPCISPAAPNGAPLSATRPTEILVSAAQVWKARTMSSCQAAAVGNWALRSWNKTLESPAIDVPSGAKLRVRWRGSRQGSPMAARTIRLSRYSKIERS